MHKKSLWRIISKGFNASEERLREALYTLGNGYMGTRGAVCESTASSRHYPGTYIAGAYNRLSTHIAHRTILNEDLVNCPDWTFLTFKIGGGEWFAPSASNIISYRQQLDMLKGLLSWHMYVQNRQGLITLIQIHRLVHMMHPHCAAIRYSITPQNYSDWITVYSLLDGTVTNQGVERYRQLNAKHLRLIALGSFGRNGTYLSMRTIQSRIEMAEAARIQVFENGVERLPEMKVVIRNKKMVGREFKLFVRKKTGCTIEKVAAIYTSHDKGVTNPVREAIKTVRHAERFISLMQTHRKAWRRLWDKFDISIDSDFFSQKALRFHIFHLLQTASLHNTEIDAGLPARGLHGEAYRGHIFWDEIFTVPFYTLHAPQIAKASLMYRYHRLAAARRAAAASGYRGAMFPWQSASSGSEETQVIHLNPLSGKWGDDLSHRQRHISLAIAYNIWQYYRKTADMDFMVRYGAEMFLSIVQFGVSLTSYDARDGRYHTRGIMGPDEFHEKYPHSSRPGLKDNAYTNILIVWAILKARKLLEELPVFERERIVSHLGLKPKDFAQWQDISRRMNIVFNEEGIISQFAGYFDLEELDWNYYRSRYKNIKRMDRILKAEGKSPDRYKVSKQADVLMIFYLLSPSEIESIFKLLGYRYGKNTLKKNYDYYLSRTSHGSTLSAVVHCLLSLWLKKTASAWQWFREVLESDIYDTQGGTTPEGIHVGVMGGSLDIVLRGFAGLKFDPDKIIVKPQLPPAWKRLKFRIFFKGQGVLFLITHDLITVVPIHFTRKLPPVTLEISGKSYLLTQEQRLTIPYQHEP